MTDMTSLIIEAREATYEVYLSILGDNIFRILERIESKQPFYTTLQGAEVKLVQLQGSDIK